MIYDADALNSILPPRRINVSLPQYIRNTRVMFKICSVYFRNDPGMYGSVPAIGYMLQKRNRFYLENSACGGRVQRQKRDTDIDSAARIFWTPILRPSPRVNRGKFKNLIKI